MHIKCIPGATDQLRAQFRSGILYHLAWKEAVMHIFPKSLVSAPSIKKIAPFISLFFLLSYER